ncbi:MAG: hypothetical protein V1859_04440 [archaeon]
MKNNFSIFGFLGPIFSSLLGLLGAIIVIVLLKLLNIFLNVEILSDISSFLLKAIFFLFALSIIIGYANYFANLNRGLNALAPFFSSIAGALIIIFIIQLLEVINNHVQINFLKTISALVMQNIALVFALLVCISYAGYFLEMLGINSHTGKGRK